MKHITSTLFAGLTSLILLSSTAYSQNGGLRFSLKDLNTDLRTYDMAAQSTATAINNKGEVAGDILLVKTSEQECFYFPVKGSPQAFHVVTHTPQQGCFARAIDDLGNVAGSVWTELNANRAFRRNTKGTLYRLDPAVPTTDSFGFGISNGTVVGYVGGDSNRSARWDTNGTLTNLLPYLEAYPTGINSSGEIVGYYYWFGLGLGFSMINGTLTTLGPLGGNHSSAAAINASGYIVGVAENTAGCWDVAVWSTTVADLGNCWGSPLAISGDNWIVGYNQTTGVPCENWGSAGNCTAFLSTMIPNCIGPYDLNTLLDSSGAGWVLKEATGINDSHQIVGYGIAPNGEHHAFLLTPNNQQLCYPN